MLRSRGIKHPRNYDDETFSRQGSAIFAYYVVRPANSEKVESIDGNAEEDIVVLVARLPAVSRIVASASILATSGIPPELERVSPREHAGELGVGLADYQPTFANPGVGNDSRGRFNAESAKVQALLGYGRQRRKHSIANAVQSGTLLEAMQ